MGEVLIKAKASRKQEISSYMLEKTYYVYKMPKFYGRSTYKS